MSITTSTIAPLSTQAVEMIAESDVLGGVTVDALDNGWETYYRVTVGEQVRLYASPGAAFAFAASLLP